jgi:undecaprenyl-phosphate 4-deoxy-4-formamido-L-arabinose transferase
LLAILFFFIGLALFGIGLLGEYVGRIYAQVRERPRYVIEGILEDMGEDAPRVIPLPESGVGIRQ